MGEHEVEFLGGEGVVGEDAVLGNLVVGMRRYLQALELRAGGRGGKSGLVEGDGAAGVCRSPETLVMATWKGRRSQEWLPHTAGGAAAKSAPWWGVSRSALTRCADGMPDLAW